MTRRQADLLLITTCAVWGAAFPLVKYALGLATPLGFVALRFALAAVVLSAVTPPTRPTRGELAGGLLLSGILLVGFATQAVGLVITTPSRSAFIIATSSILAPFIAWAAVAERPRWWTVGALGVAGAGLYLLTQPESGGLNRGDLWTFVTAAVFGAQIVAVRELSIRYDGRRLVWLQTVITALGMAVAAVALEDVEFAWSVGLVAALGYTSVFATVLAFLWQMQAQRHMSSARAALLFCTEPVFAAFASWLALGETLSAVQWAGGGLIVAGMIVADLPIAKRVAESAVISGQ